MSMRKISKSGARQYKERSQPESRRHMGGLEKKKDYKLRATDYQEKKGRLKELHRKALDRNPEEFYFHMVNSKTQDGFHFEKQKESVDTDSDVQKALIASQGLRYVNHKLNVERHKIDKMKASLHFMNIGSHKTTQPNRHTFFVDTDEEARTFDPAVRLATHPSTLPRVFNRPRLDQLANSASTSSNGSSIKSELRSVDKQRKKQYNELLKRTQRYRELKVAAQKLQVKQDLAKWNPSDAAEASFKPKRVKRGNTRRAPQYVWPMERKK